MSKDEVDDRPWYRRHIYELIGWVLLLIFLTTELGIRGLFFGIWLTGIIVVANLSFLFVLDVFDYIHHRQRVVLDSSFATGCASLVMLAILIWLYPVVLGI